MAAVLSDVQAIMWSTDTERASSVALTQPTVPSPGPLSSIQPLCPSLSSHGFIPSCPWDTWSARSTIPHSLTAQSSEFNSICVSGENFSFWSVCVFPAVDSVTHWGLTRKKRLCRGCDTWTILSGNVGGQLCQQVQPAATFSDIVLQSGVLPGTAGTF